MEDIDVVDLTEPNKIKKFFNADFYKSLLAILVYYFVFNAFDRIIVIPLKVFFNHPFEGRDAIFVAAVNVSIYLVLFISLLAIHHNELKKDFKRIKDTNKAAIFFFLSVIAMFFVNMFAAIISRSIIQMESTNEATINSTLSNPYAYMIYAPCVIIIGPIVEEFIFRKSYYGVLKNKYLFLIISAIIFGGMHITTSYDTLRLTYPALQAFGYTLAIGIPYFAMGLTFGVIYLKSDRNLIASIAVHILNNFTATVIALIIL
ncbi:MAG: CPBP family intramembrane metalloprotease [Acholeplasmatales bacterium]|nr:CPBP family intramembrane metalloprotease [Acholeplasmatales bacterium]